MDTQDAEYLNKQGQKYARWHRRGQRAWQHNLTEQEVQACEVCGKAQTRSSTDSTPATTARS